MGKKLYAMQAAISIILGIFLIFNSKIRFIGAAIGINEISTQIMLLFGAFFLIAGIALIIIVSKK